VNRNKINLDEALVRAEKAISEPFRNAAQGRKVFYTLTTKSAVLRAMGRDGDADGVMDEAVAMADAPVMGIHLYGTALLAAGKKDQAMAIFKQNRQRHPDETFVTNVGLARGYTPSATPGTRSRTGRSRSRTSRRIKRSTCRCTSRR